MTDSGEHFRRRTRRQTHLLRYWIFLATNTFLVVSQVYVRTVVAFTPGSFHGSIRQVCPSWELRANMRGRADWAKRAREDDIRRKVSGLIYIYIGVML